MRTFLRHSISSLLTTIISLSAWAVNPDCPYCRGTGMYKEYGGAPYSGKIFEVCRNCGTEYDAAYSHDCTCRYCADYVPQGNVSSGYGEDAAMDEDYYIQILRQQMATSGQHTNKDAAFYGYEREYVEPTTENVGTGTDSESSSYLHKIQAAASSMPDTSRQDSGIPAWVWLIAGGVIAIAVKIFSD